MNDDELLKRIGRELRDDAARAPSADEDALSGSLDAAFEDRLFEKLALAETKVEAPRNLIPFPPNRSSLRSRWTAGVGIVFAAAAAFFLVQRAPSAALGSYELSSSSESMERGAENAPPALITATVGRPLTLVLRPTTKASATPDVHVFSVFGRERTAWISKVETATSGALRVTTEPAHAGRGELEVVVVPKDQRADAEPRLVFTKPLDVRASSKE